MANTLDGKIVAFLVANDDVNQAELTQPWTAVEEAGGTPVLIAPTPAPVTTSEGTTFAVDRTTPGLRMEDYHALVLPGGKGAVALRDDLTAVNFLCTFVDAGKPIAAICHGPAIMIEAGILTGRTLTSHTDLRADIEAAGARWVDEEVCVDNGLVTSRGPADLPAFCAKLVEEFAEGRHRTIDLTATETAATLGDGSQRSSR